MTFVIYRDGGYIRDIINWCEANIGPMKHAHNSYCGEKWSIICAEVIKLGPVAYRHRIYIEIHDEKLATMAMLKWV